MDIILKETDYVRDLLHRLEAEPSQSLGRRPSRNLRLISRYLCHIEGKKPEAVYQTLVQIMETHYPEFSIASWQTLLLDYAKTAKQTPLSDIDYIPVTSRELSIIAHIPRKPDRRVAFALLCLSKYRNLLKEGNHNWLNHEYKEIFRMANVTATVKEQCRIIHSLKEAGYIHMSKMVDNLSIQVCFADVGRDTEEVLQIQDFRNLGYEYLLYLKEPFFRCQRCHALTRRRSNNDKYCSNCRSEVLKKQKRHFDIISRSEKMKSS